MCCQPLKQRFFRLIRIIAIKKPRHFNTCDNNAEIITFLFVGIIIIVDCNLYRKVVYILRNCILTGFDYSANNCISDKQILNHACFFEIDRTGFIRSGNIDAELQKKFIKFRKPAFCESLIVLIVAAIANRMSFVVFSRQIKIEIDCCITDCMNHILLHLAFHRYDSTRI